MTNISNYNAIQSNLYVRISIAEYKNTPGGSYVPMVLRFSDDIVPLTIAGEEYKGIGNLMGVTDSSSELKASEQELTISITGIPDSSIDEIINSKIKGSPVTIYRVLFDTNTEAVLNIDNNPMLKFQGYVTNIGLTEEYKIDERMSINTLTLVCSNKLKMLSNKSIGRKTNSHSMKRYFPNDVSFDRVASLGNAYFDFGKKS